MAKLKTVYGRCILSSCTVTQVTVGINSPFTLLSSTQPPAATILFVSTGLDGLWSCDSSTISPPTHANALESPTLAYKRRLMKRI